MKHLAEQFEFPLEFQRNDSVSNFYNKEGDPEYYKKYEREHGARLDFIFDKYNFKEIKNEKLCDWGGGTHFFIRKFDKSNFLASVDRATVSGTENINSYLQDLNFIRPNLFSDGFLDKSFCFEVLEHLESPYSALCSIKKFTKINGEIYISIPTVNCHHNTPMPGLFYPESNFEEFLLQMALPIQDKTYSNHSFSSVIYKCLNRPWNEKKLKFPKDDEKYIWATPLEVTNL